MKTGNRPAILRVGRRENKPGSMGNWFFAPLRQVHRHIFAPERSLQPLQTDLTTNRPVAFSRFS